jgi:uncharacterized membrane protein/predicted DsbA family dithiol-disulfide isomerase
MTRARALSWLALVLSLAGLAASAASLADYLATSPGFCAASGCQTIRASAWSHPLGVPMPAVGVLYFAAMTALAVVARPRLRRALAIAGGAWAIALVAVQAFVVGAWCSLCLVVDPIAIALAVVVAAGAGTVRARRGGVAIAIALVGGAAVFALWPREAPPGVIADARVDVVEYVDFECPYCRALDPTVRAALLRADRPIRVERKMVPLPQHSHALDAALAWCCADAQGKGDAMAVALFAADPDELTPDGCTRIAARVGCDVDRYRAALVDPEIRARVARDVADAKRAGVRMLPTVVIRGRAFTGANHSADELAAAL